MTGSKAKQPGHWANASNGTLQNLSLTDKAKSPNAFPLKQSLAAMEDLIQELLEK